MKEKEMEQTPCEEGVRERRKKREREREMERNWLFD